MARNIRELVEERDVLRETKRSMDAKLAEINSLLDINEGELIEAMDDAGIDKTRVGSISVSVADSVVPVVEDWDQFHQYILEHNAMYLLHRRVSTGPFREIIEMDGSPPPGTDTMVKRTLSMRKTA